jgi:phospholipid/cholesterol/gamma-HCH transport system substrate-binding protein
MKVRASNLLIGTAALMAITIALSGFLGYRKFHAVAQRSPLRIVFEGSASGLAKGGSVNFDGVHVGEVTSIRLDGPRKVVVLVTLENSAPIRKDTVVGIEAQGLTGLMAIALTGGDAAAPPVPLDADGIPTLTADLSEAQSIRDTLHNVDRVLVDNRDVMNNAVRNFETYTATLAANGDVIDDALRKADTALAGFDHTIAEIDGLIPGIAGGKDGELFKKVKSIRELAQGFNKRSAAYMDEGRRSLLDISEAATKVNQKFDPQGPVPRRSSRP